ncbi:LPXTG cell wall anchor domain-containing protein [Glycomyces xiaoerkulensis]|uniref:LPXTG cell wall anchor domain-containing protein n=1 Tax=Glycomyces xiaoerkulensis TaxID=2038139 RepID=UPI0012FFE8E7|nr:LPXTG cell wall anchor domain-containing protein [Glycomyces xiaoerkulensis]
MNRTLRRVLGLAGSVVVGLGGAVAFASGAQAHHPVVTGEAACTDDGWKVTWTVEFVAPTGGEVPIGTIEEIDPEDSDLDADLVDQAGYHGDTVTGVQTFDSSVTEASLKVRAFWDYPDDHHWGDVNEWSQRGRVTAPSDCDPDQEPTPEIGLSAQSDCFGIAVTADNNNSEALAEFTFTPSVGDPVVGTPKVGEEFTEYFAVEDPEAGQSVIVSVDGEEFETYQWDVTGTNCEWGTIWETCDGLEFELAIPEDAPSTTFTFAPSNGEERVVELAPGESVTELFEASGDELTVAYVIDDGEDAYEGEATWTKPEDCEEVPGEETTPVADEQLPSTGSNLTIMVSAAAALVAAAAVLFFIARRRRAAATDW